MAPSRGQLRLTCLASLGYPRYTGTWLGGVTGKIREQSMLTCGFDGRRGRMVGNSLESYLHQDAFGPSQ
jgi:hypothetical protein